MNDRIYNFLAFVKTRNINLIENKINLLFYLQVKMPKRKLGPYLNLEEKNGYHNGQENCYVKVLTVNLILMTHKFSKTKTL